jgi:hypothetical protein
MRTRTTFQKRQKEIARMEKQRDKAARRMQRKLEAAKSGSADVDATDAVTVSSPPDPDDVSGHE